MQISVHMEDSLNTRQKCSSGIDRIQNLTPFQYHCVETSSCSYLCYRLCILGIRVYISFLISVSFSRWSALWLTSQYFLNSCYVILIPNCTDPPTFNSLLNWVAEKYWKYNQIWIFLYKEAEGIVRRRRGWRTEAYLSICRWQAVSLCVRERWFLTAPDAGEDLISGYTFSVPVSCWFVTHTHISPVLCFFLFVFPWHRDERNVKKKRDLDRRYEEEEGKALKKWYDFGHFCYCETSQRHLPHKEHEHLSLSPSFGFCLL